MRLFFAHDLRIDESDIGDTAFYHPWHRAMIHYKRDRYFLFGGEVAPGVPEAGQGIWQYACGEKGFRGAEGTWRDAEDGLLSMNAIAQGSVDSVVSYRLTVPAHGQGALRVWMAAHENAEEAAALQAALLEQGFDEALAATAAHWQAHVAHCRPDLDKLPPRVAELFTRSLLIIRTQVDKRGAILASNDSDIMETARAHYSYMWPRDGALVSYALDKVGLRDMSRPFFEFCARVLPKDRAALMHKYGPDGTVGASWHPWIMDGQPEIPFQEDGTALVVWALWHHYQRYGDQDFLAAMYRRLARPAAEFMAGFRDPKTRLPLPSWDIWEERRGAHIWTTATVAAALAAAADIARLLGDAKRADTFHAASQEVKDALLEHFWDEEAGRFARMVTTGGGRRTGPRHDRGLVRLRPVRLRRPRARRPQDGRHHAHAGPPPLGQGRRGRPGPLRARLLLPRLRRLRQGPRQPLDHLHPLAGRVVHRDGQDGGADARRAGPAGVGQPLRPGHRGSCPSRSTRTPCSRSPSPPSPGPTPSSSRRRPTTWTSWRPCHKKRMYS